VVGGKKMWGAWKNGKLGDGRPPREIERKGKVALFGRDHRHFSRRRRGKRGFSGRRKSLLRYNKKKRI